MFVSVRLGKLVADADPTKTAPMNSVDESIGGVDDVDAALMPLKLCLCLQWLSGRGFSR